MGPSSLHPPEEEAFLEQNLRAGDLDLDPSFSPACNDCRRRHRKCPHRAEIPLPAVEMDSSDSEVDDAMSDALSGFADPPRAFSKPARNCAVKPPPLITADDAQGRKRRGRPPKWLVNERARKASKEEGSISKAERSAAGSEPYRPRKRRAIDDYEFSGKFDEIILQKFNVAQSESSGNESEDELVALFDVGPNYMDDTAETELITCQLDPLAEFRKNIEETDQAMAAIFDGEHIQRHDDLSTPHPIKKNQQALSYFPLSSIRSDA